MKSDTPETDAFFARNTTLMEKWEQMQKLERERNEWQAITKEALASFRCTQRPEIYPEGHWSRRAQSLAELPAKFANVSCSQCGRDFGPGEHGFSHCSDHSPKDQCADCKWSMPKDDR